MGREAGWRDHEGRDDHEVLTPNDPPPLLPPRLHRLWDVLGDLYLVLPPLGALAVAAHHCLLEMGHQLHLHACNLG